MIPVLTKEQAYKLDKDTIESGHLSQEELMDNAGKAVAQFFCEKIDNPFNQKVVVVCGKGNNGGDGVIAHSYLKYYRVSSKILFTEKKHGHSKLLKKNKISKSEYSIYNYKTKFDKYDWIIDGIFGIGLSREIEGIINEIFDNINKNENIISIDTPSGIYIDNNSDDHYSIHSKYTITFGYPKLGHYFNCINNLYIVDIGFKNVTNTIVEKIDFYDIDNILKQFNKKVDKHKYKSEVHIVAGEDDMPGAAYLACRSALVTGSGYINFYADSEENPKLINHINNLIPEVVIRDYSFTPLLNDSRVPYWIYNGEMGVFRNNKTLVGPGIGNHGVLFPQACEDPYNWASQTTGYYVFDAGALSNLRDYYERLREDNERLDINNVLELLPPQCILTPHYGELKELFSIDYPKYYYKEKIMSYDFLKEIQNKLSSRILILKSFNTYIITQNMIYIMDKGPSLLATAGTGDVLSGILVSLLSQGYSRLEASILGTYLHAEAANYYMNNISKDGMTASDLIDCIPFAFNILRKHE